MIEIIPNWHPVFVHFTIAPLMLAASLYLIAVLVRRPHWRQPALVVARWNLFLGVLFTGATVAAGFIAYNSVAHDDISHAAMTDHRNWALATAAVYLLFALWEGWRVFRRRGSSVLVLTGLLGASILLATTGFKGGEIVFRHGLGVMSLPHVDDHHHTAREAGPHALGASEPSHGAAPAADPAGESAAAKPPEAHGKTHVHPDGKTHTH